MKKSDTYNSLSFGVDWNAGAQFKVSSWLSYGPNGIIVSLDVRVDVNIYVCQ